jgi:5-methylcytosine-specific restriction enzyme subunit McrC
VRIFATDCSPLRPQPDKCEAEWLRRLVDQIRSNDLVVALSSDRKKDDDEPIVFCERDGTWWAGRYVGSVSFEGSTLTITPRFGLSTLRHWLSEAVSIVLTPTPGHLREDESFIVQLLASVWAHGFAQAARHGLPALRRDVSTKGPTIRGRLDVAASLRTRILGEVVSIRSEKSLDHAASRAIVAAYVVLHRWLALPDEAWMPAQARKLLPSLTAVTGARPRTPTKSELGRVRYTPITVGFASIAELSRQIANRQGLATDADDKSQSQGILLDVAELWEMYVLSVLKKAAVPSMVTHGTRDTTATRTLLRSDITGQGMGTLIPDAIIHTIDVVQAVADAKYKPLWPTAARQNGVQREDLYQMAAYLNRFGSADNQAAWGVLVYPHTPDRPTTPPSETQGPWSFSDGKRLAFMTLPHESDEAVAKMRDLIFAMSPDPARRRA